MIKGIIDVSKMTEGCSMSDEDIERCKKLILLMNKLFSIEGELDIEQLSKRHKSLQQIMSKYNAGNENVATDIGFLAFPITDIASRTDLVMEGQDGERSQDRSMISHTLAISVMGTSLVSRWNKNKKKFIFTKALKEALEETDIGNDFTRFKLPFKYVWIQFPSVFVEIPEFHGKTTYNGKILWSLIGQEERDHNTQLILLNEIDVGDRIIHSVASAVYKDNLLQVLEEISSPSLLKYNELVVKGVLYINSEKPMIEERDDSKKIWKAAQKGGKKLKKAEEYGKILIVGKGFRIKGKETETDRKIGVRFWVRGHFRNQAHGPGMSLRKIIWIQPHKKGPDTAKLIHRDYEISKENERR